MFLQKITAPAPLLALVATALPLIAGLVARGDEVRRTAAAPAALPLRAAPVPRPARAEEPAAVVARLVEALKKQPAPPPPAKGELGLYLIDLDKGGVTLIVSAVGGERAYCGSPSWSPDGRRIYFDTSPGFGRFTETRLQVLELTDRGVTLSSPGPGNCPTASPDGKRLAYRLNADVVPGVKPGIYATAAGGREASRLSGDGFAKWSPDGRHLLTISFSNPCDLSLADAATGAASPVQLADHGVYSVPTWAGDGFLTAVVRSGRTQKFAVALLDVTDPAKAKVKEGLWQRGDGLAAEPLYPVYSPTARRGVFVGREPKGQALYTFEPGGRPARLEPRRPLDPKIASLALSPDGRYLLFCGDRAE